MYGLESLFGNLATSAITPGISSFIKEGTQGTLADWAKKLVNDDKMAKLIGQIGGGTLGALTSSGVGAGIGALTGGKYGAQGGAMTGLMSGGYGALKSDAIQKALGFGTPQLPKTAMMQGKALTTAPVPSSTDMSFLKDSGVGASGLGVKDPYAAAFDTKNLGLGNVDSTALPTGDTLQATDSGTEAKPMDYMDIVGKVMMPSAGLGTSFTGSQIDAYYNRLRQQQAKEAADAKAAATQAWVNSLYKPAYAAGGAVDMEVGTREMPAHVHMPEWFIDDYIQSGGLAALQGHATGGYINTQPVNPDDFHPQSQIPSAQPYAAASPQRHDVINFDKGGLLDGPGDGMSDDIPANIDGKEPVRVADGEYVVPKNIAAAKQEQLKKMMQHVRSAAHPHKGKQIKQDAAKRAFIHTMSGVKA